MNLYESIKNNLNEAPTSDEQQIQKLLQKLVNIQASHNSDHPERTIERLNSFVYDDLNSLESKGILNKDLYYAGVKFLKEQTATDAIKALIYFIKQAATENGIKVTMNESTSIKESVNWSDLNDEIKEQLDDGDTVALMKCDNCGSIVTTEEVTETRKVDMEDYYGVGSDFPDHHYQEFSVCPNCGDIDIYDIGDFTKEDFDDIEV